MQFLAVKHPYALVVCRVDDHAIELSIVGLFTTYNSLHASKSVEGEELVGHFDLTSYDDFHAYYQSTASERTEIDAKVACYISEL